MTRTTTPGPRRRTRAGPPLLAVLAAGVLLTAACSGQGAAIDPDGSTSPAVEATPSGTPTAGTSVTPPTSEQGAPMGISISTAGVELRGTLEDTATARDFAALLPLTLTLEDYTDAEKVADLPLRLDTTGASPAYTGRPGDITYYAPWGNLALFHGNGPYAPGLIRLGRLAPGAVKELANLNGTVTIALDTTPGTS